MARALAAFVLWPLAAVFIWLPAITLVLMGAEVAVSFDSRASSSRRRVGWAVAVRLAPARGSGALHRRLQYALPLVSQP